jgi:tripartite-type tricarboxylate transporter receptor subunit TctC
MRGLAHDEAAEPNSSSDVSIFCEMMDCRAKRREATGRTERMKKTLLALSILLAAALPAAAQQDDVAAFFKGKTMRLVVGIGVGSGYDINARLLARHMAAHIPGQPTIIVQNQPGAGSLSMTNALYHTGPFDGTVMGASFNGMPTTPLLQPGGARFDPVKLNWLGSTNRETQAMYVWHTAPAQALEDMKSKEIVMGAQAPGSTQFDYPVLANRLFGFKFKVVTGYESTPKIHLAMESGEAHGTIANWSTLKAISTNWITEKKIRILAQWALTKSPELGDVPMFLDQAKTDAERAALRLMLARLEYGRPFFLPPNVPAARVEALRRAFDATMKDPAYLAEADKLKIDVDPLSGEQVATLVEQVSRTNPETVARVRAAMENK